MQPRWELNNAFPSVRAVSSYFLSWEPEFSAGTVHSVFAASFNVEAAGHLLHVGAPPHPLSCLGLNVPAEELAPVLSVLRPGNRAVIKGHSLRLYTAERTAVLDYSGYEPVDLSIGPPAPAERRTGLSAALASVNLDGRLGIPWDGALHRALGILSCRGADQAELAEAIRFLLGRGKGLTPSGDDILMGYGAGRLLFGGAGPFLSALAAVLGRQTTDVSLAYLRALLDGCVNEDYAALFHAVRLGKSQRYPILLNYIQRTGHTSGSDSLLGLRTAIVE